MIFIPQFAENVLRIKAGTGGYLITFLALFSGISAPLSGKLLDTKGTRFVMTMGFAFTILGTLYLGYVATSNMNFSNILIGVALMGFGVGFTLGATLSPGLLIGFVVNSAKDLQPNLNGVLAQGGMKMPTSVGGNAAIGKQFEALQNADVTTIVDQLKGILKQFLPPQALDGIEKMRLSIETMFQSTMNTGYMHMFTVVAAIAMMGLVATFLLKEKGNVEETL